MHPLLKAALYAIPDGIANWAGGRVSDYAKTSGTKIVENAVQGAALSGVLAASGHPLGYVAAALVAAVKIKNIVVFARGG